VNALVIGGTGAVGQAVCSALRCRVAFTYRTREGEAMRLASRLGDALPLPLDLGSMVDIERVVDRVASDFGGLDAFVHCAGVAPESEWDPLMAVHAKSAFFGARRAAGAMRRGGNIVFVGALDAVKPVPTPPPHAGSKAALAGVTRAMAKEWGPRNVRVNMVAPGLLDEGISLSLPEKTRNEYLEHCGLRRFGKTSEVASVVAWMALENTYVTGQILTLDGAL